ncbi:MAG TPA: hypothetical protein VFI10_05380, partial [Gaiellaceae bacterium]|nr:hypothetical protein [Gaiellaceae bacterium]
LQAVSSFGRAHPETASSLKACRCRPPADSLQAVSSFGRAHPETASSLKACRCRPPADSLQAVSSFLVAGTQKLQAA